MKTEYQNKVFGKIKEKVETSSFKIRERVYAPLHTTSYPMKILRELQTQGFLARRGTLRKVLLENGLTYKHYQRIRGGINVYHYSITCFEVLKKII